MELAITVLCWTLAVCIAIMTIMIGTWFGEMTNLVKARTQSEKRLHP